MEAIQSEAIQSEVIQSETICVHGSMTQQNKEHFGSISMPIYQTATFSHPGVGQSTGYDYSRVQNPTRSQLEETIRELEHGADTIAFSSGMAAVSAVMESFLPGDEIIAGDDLYGGTIRLFDQINKKNGITISYQDTCSLQAVKDAITERTKAIYIETPTNPMMNVTDIQGMAEIAKEHGLLLIVDNTFLTPYYQKPILLGADLVIHSGTKYLGGHNDTLAGFVVTKTKELGEKIRFISKTTGATLAPMDSWLIVRGIKTLAIRLDRQSENAAMIAEFLTKHPRVNKVYYVGLEEHPGYEIHHKQATGAGGMLSFRVDSKETAVRVLEKIQIIQYAESLGGVESLMTYPMLQTHADIPQEIREQKGIDDTLLRLSVGIEAAKDLILDLKQAFEE